MFFLFLAFLPLLILTAVTSAVPKNQIYQKRTNPQKEVNGIGTSTLEPAPSSSLIPAPTQIPGSGDLEMIMNQINDFRLSNGLTRVETNDTTCRFAKTRVLEISTNFSHEGFNNRVNSNALPYPPYKLVTENIAMTSIPSAVVNLWINSPEHAQNMKSDTPYVCVGMLGNYYAYEGLKPR